MNRSFLLATTCLTTFAATAASGVDVTADFLGTGAGLQLEVTRNGTMFDTFAGQYQHVISSSDAPVPNIPIPGVYNMYCAQLGTPPVQNPSTFELDSFDNTILDISANADARAQLVADIFGFYGALPGAGGISDAQAAAFQLIIWEILYDWTVGEDVASMDITSGMVSAAELGGGALNQAVVDEFDDIVANLAANPGIGSLNPNDADFAAGMTSSFGQDQVFSPIPGPGTTGLVLAGAVIGFSRRRR